MKWSFFCPLFFLLFGACAADESVSDITGVKWVAQILDGNEVKVKENNHQVYIEFVSVDNQVRGMAGCNNFFGTFKTESCGIEISLIGVTKSTCPDIYIENKFFGVLDKADGYEVKRGNLYLKQGKKVLARFGNEAN